MKRTEEREVIVLALYSIDITGQSVEHALRTLKEHTLKIDEYTPYIEETVKGVIEHREELDEIITRNLRNYKFSRISYVDRQILRFATYELKYQRDSVPPVIAINEGINLCKTYSDLNDEKSSAFLNSVLDKIYQDIQ